MGGGKRSNLLQSPLLPGALRLFHELGLCINVITQLAPDLTDMYALSLGALGVVRIYQSNPSQLCYNILIYTDVWRLHKL